MTALKKGTAGFILTPHKSDRGYKARAVLMHDSPADQETIEVELQEDFYCCETGDVIDTTRRLFRPVLAGMCRVCGCTDGDCRECIERTGEPCSWVEPDLCSACVGEER